MIGEFLNSYVSLIMSDTLLRECPSTFRCVACRRSVRMKNQIAGNRHQHAEAARSAYTCDTERGLPADVAIFTA
jgi:hypothetical protein